MINLNERLPEAEFSLMTEDGMKNPSTEELFSGKKVVLFAVPGAFTPTCSESHLPGYVALADKFKEKGIDDIVCVSVNDAFVMHSWGKALNAEHITMLADGDGSFAKALGVEMDTSGFGGIRSRRYSMLVEDGIVSKLNLEEGGQFEVSDAETLLNSL